MQIFIHTLLETFDKRNWKWIGGIPGAEAYAVIHSVVDTAKKQALSPFKELQLTAKLKPSLLVL